MKEFTTSVAARDETFGNAVTIKVDGFEVTFSPCTESQMAMLMASASATGNTMESVADTINFFFSLIDDRDQFVHMKHRLFDKEDPFSVPELTDILLYLVEEWSARPTKQPSDFTPSQRSAGRKSTARLQDTA